MEDILFKIGLSFSIIGLFIMLIGFGIVTFKY